MELTGAFVASLGSLDRKGLAVLRRSLGYDPGAYPAAYPFVEPYVHEDWQRDPFYLLAGLFALYERAEAHAEAVSQQDERGPSLGAAMGRLFELEDRSPSVERRFVTLLDADEDQLPHRLRQMVALLRSKDVRIDWPRLLDDLINWSHPKRFVQQQWARDFYRAPSNAASNDESETEKE